VHPQRDTLTNLSPAVFYRLPLRKSPRVSASFYHYLLYFAEGMPAAQISGIITILFEAMPIVKTYFSSSTTRPLLFTGNIGKLRNHETQPGKRLTY
jgi:hypothetical protein